MYDGEPGSADQVGELIAFLLSDASDHVSGTTVYIDAAESLL
jgi:enoyl-[acyl-carrier-protein] reductase (NADH)